jgi:hypothetical protein
MNADKIIKKAQEEFTKLSNATVNRVIGLSKTEDGWLVSLEVVERVAIPETMDVLGLYEVRLDAEGNIQEFGRKKLRKRGDTEE